MGVKGQSAKEVSGYENVLGKKNQMAGFCVNPLSRGLIESICLYVFLKLSWVIFSFKFFSFKMKISHL